MDMPTAFGDFKLKAYTQKDTGEHHLALYKGSGMKMNPFLYVYTALVLPVISLDLAVVIVDLNYTKQWK